MHIWGATLPFSLECRLKLPTAATSTLTPARVVTSQRLHYIRVKDIEGRTL